MKFEIPPLPYSVDSLSPVISRQTVICHYCKHLGTYINNLNHLINDSGYESMPLDEIIRVSEGQLFNNAAQVWNHLFYFHQFMPNPSHHPKGILAEQILSQYDSVDELKNKIVDAGLKLFGSGWVWLSSDEEGMLFITQSSDAGNPIKSGLNPVLTIDVWEHAYYLDYQNRRGDYLTSIWDIIDWDIIESRYE